MSPTETEAQALRDHEAALRVHKTLEGPKPPACSLAALIASAMGALVVEPPLAPTLTVRQFERRERARANSRTSRMTTARAGGLMAALAR